MRLVFLLIAVIAVKGADQQVLYSSQDKAQRDATAGVFSTVSPFVPSETAFTPLNELAYISTSTFTTLTHPAFPQYDVRIKKSDFCDGTVGAYTGYIDIEARHLFFYFFESRNDPDKDDVVFWTNGGPGGSSSVGLFMELGPCRIVNSSSTAFNPYAWNDKANIFFIDQPVNVGFSYAEYGEAVSNTLDAAKDIAAFVAIFFEHFSKFKGRAFHMAGESYGGRYIPVFASEIFDQNTKLVEAGLIPINLSSIMIGNGCSDFSYIAGGKYDMQCRPVSVPPVLPISSCVRMKQALPRCKKWMKESCFDQFESISCTAAWLFCSEEISAPFSRTGLNPYDMSKICDGVMADTLCYPITKDIDAYLSRPDVRSILGVDPALPANFSGVNRVLNHAFISGQDHMFPNQIYIAALLERGVRTLIYAGANDFACNWVGNERMTLDTQWTGQEEFVAQPLREWEVDGQVAGLTRSAGPYTFATIYGAGHMVPYDKPVESLELVNRWLAQEPL